MRQEGRRVAALLGVALVGVTPPPVARAAEEGWRAVRSVDAVTDQLREGATYASGDDEFLVICTHNTLSRLRFWIAVRTKAHLGRARTRPLTYRVGDEPATTSKWDYSPREVVPSWPLEDKHIVQRLLAGGAQRLVLRLVTSDGSVHDVTVPIDAQARELMSKTLAACGASAS